MPEQTLVLITRTRPAASLLADRILEMGCEPFECTPFQLEGPREPETVAEDLAAALPADRVILTSHEAVRQAVRLAGVGVLNRALVIVPGQGTAAVATDLGLSNVIYPDRHGTSEAMLAMPELREVDGLDVVVLAAAGGRGLIGEVLERRGAAVERIHVYRREACPLPDDAPDRVTSAASVVTLGASLEAVTGLVEGLGGEALQRLFRAPLVVPSGRIAERAGAMGFRDCRVAAGAGDEAMVAELARVT